MQDALQYLFADQVLPFVNIVLQPAASLSGEATHHRFTNYTFEGTCIQWKTYQLVGRNI
jgi:hypothetical protein